MAIVLSAHAREATAVRQLQREWIERTVLAAERTDTDPRAPELTRSYRTIPEAGERMLRVVHRPEGPVLVVGRKAPYWS